MGKLNYVDNIINKLNDISLSIFESFNSYIKKLRTKKKVTNNEYNVCDIFDIVINSCSDNTTLRDSTNKNSNFNDSHLSTMHYWLKKVYDTDMLDNMYYNIYHFSECIDKSIFISCNDPLTNICKIIMYLLETVQFLMFHLKMIMVKIWLLIQILLL